MRTRANAGRKTRAFSDPKDLNRRKDDWRGKKKGRKMCTRREGGEKDVENGKWVAKEYERGPKLKGGLEREKLLQCSGALRRRRRNCGGQKIRVADLWKKMVAAAAFRWRGWSTSVLFWSEVEMELYGFE